jgi:AraC-like DNA-binding protein
MPSDRRLVRIATAIADDPSDPRTREEWAAWAGLSERTLSRQFQAQVSMSFAQWRKQALLIHALERLLRGESVSSVADALGYATPSNFISMFRKALGDTPAHYAARSPRGAD